LPVVLGNPLHFERDSEFAHGNEYGSFGPAGKALYPHTVVDHAKTEYIVGAVIPTRLKVSGR
jgi:hypothetical protein